MGNTPRTPRQDGPNDVGTLWKMQRLDRTSRCALMAWPTTWELRVLVDDETLLSKHCARADEAFTLAARWKDRMLEQGWEPIVRPSRARLDQQSA